VPLDHTSFADDVVAIFQDAAVEGADVESNLVRRRCRQGLLAGRLPPRGAQGRRARCAPRRRPRLTRLRRARALAARSWPA
jgi:hypothetical protein